MNRVSIHQTLNCSAKQAGFMPSVWSAINVDSYDRTPEITGVQETML
jgi:hypothetical protein